MSNEEYRQIIIETVNNCNNKRFLKFLYELIISFKKKWGI